MAQAVMAPAHQTTGKKDVYKRQGRQENVGADHAALAGVVAAFELVLDLDGWSMVTTCRGYAYIKSEYLSETPVSYSQEDLYIMAHLLAGEAQCYPDEEQIYVGSVVLNRVAHKEFPNTIKDVVFQKGQYACTWDGNYDREPTEQNWKNARILLEHGSVLPSYVCLLYTSRWKSRTT